MRLGWTLASALLCSCSPFGSGAFTCETSGQCMLAGTPGMCQSSGMCSYSDSSCVPSGQRYGAQAGSLSGSCVGGDEPLDGSATPIDIAHDTVAATIDAACEIQGLDFCANGLNIEPSGPLEFDANATINTDEEGGSPLCHDYTQSSGGPTACVIVVSSLAISSGTKVTVTGDRPLIIAASTTITISGTLDVSSHGSTHGPGANGNSNCNQGAINATGNQAGASGGAGGTFANFGGDSGTGDTGDQPHKSPPSKAGSIIQKPGFVRGGCKGLGGGDGLGGLGGGGGSGTGGGGVWLYANDIEIPAGGVINAGGSGAGGGAKQSGGGGAGSGGYIRLFASTATIAGTLAANGGGGGQGGGGSLLGVGGDGDDANTNASAAHGGNNNPTAGGHGGDGSTNGQASNGQDSANGAGGGGGGQGYIVVTVNDPTLAGSTISPPLTP